MNRHRRRGRKTRYFVFAALALALFWLIEIGVQATRLLGETEVAHAGGMAITTLLDPEALRALGALDGDFDVTSTGVVVLRAGERLYAVDPESNEAADLALAEVPDKFAFDTQDAMLTVADGFLGSLAPDGTPVDGVPLAYRDARLAASVHPGAINLFGGKSGNHRLYRFLEDGSFQVLLQTDQPLIAVADSAHGTYAATQGMIVRVAWPEPVVMFKAPQAPGWGPIQSVAAAGDGLIFFSTPTSVYALKDGIAVSVVNDSGGYLRLRGNLLYVLDAKRRLLYTASPASMAIFRENKA
ncbi:MAG: hypothetical protein WC213_10240 [Arenimonas sp.]|jgi:hypothetical protein